ncbi:Uncharacterised protein [Bordetella pertussis]|nr:Uncharacterised protein [Bordetella pertussis]
MASSSTLGNPSTAELSTNASALASSSQGAAVRPGIWMRVASPRAATCACRSSRRGPSPQIHKSQSGNSSARPA